MIFGNTAVHLDLTTPRFGQYIVIWYMVLVGNDAVLYFYMLLHLNLVGGHSLLFHRLPAMTTHWEMARKLAGRYMERYR